MKMRLVFLMVIWATLVSPQRSFGQTTQPAMSTTALMKGFLIDIPADWRPVPRELLSPAYSNRAGAAVNHAFHLAGSRPTDLPYATVEYLWYGGGMTNPTATQQAQLAQQVAAYYSTAFNPPSKADRPPLFKKATVTPVSFDPANRRFTFSVVAKYDMLPDVHVEVSGCFGNDMFTICSIWSDDTYHDANKSKLLAMRDSIRLGTKPVPMNQAGAMFKRTAQVAGAVAVLALVGIQVWVLLKNRRERRAEEERLLSSTNLP